MIQKITFAFIFVFCFLFAAALAQYPPTSRVGSAAQLKGKVYTLVCFITTPQNKWTLTEKRQLLAQVKYAQNWLREEARCYGIPLQFDIGNYGMEADIVFDKIESGTASGKERVDWVARVLEKVGYKNPLVFYNQIKKQTNADNIQVIIIANQSGRGYSMAYTQEMDRTKYFVEGSILYRKTNGNSPLYTSAIAHEMLHLYGAWDLYTTFNQSFERETQARKLFPNEIMLKISYNIQELNVWELTAWLVGWKTDSKPWYLWFKPKDS